jgi:dethiobiotin synthetase
MASLSTAKPYIQQSYLSRLVAAVRRPWSRAVVAAVPVLVAAVGLALASHQYLGWKVVNQHTIAYIGHVYTWDNCIRSCNSTANAAESWLTRLAVLQAVTCTDTSVKTQMYCRTEPTP